MNSEFDSWNVLKKSLANTGRTYEDTASTPQVSGAYGHNIEDIDGPNTEHRVGPFLFQFFTLSTKKCIYQSWWTFLLSFTYVQDGRSLSGNFLYPPRLVEEGCPLGRGGDYCQSQAVAPVLFMVYYIIMDTLIKKAQIFRLGKSPVVVLPVRVWELISKRASMLEEYYQMSNSKKYQRDIASARASKKEISANALYKKLGLI